jgi:hypothetical protein
MLLFPFKRIGVGFLIWGSFVPAIVQAQAFSVPISNRVIQGEVALGDGEVVKFKALEGGMTTIKDLTTGRQIGFTGEITNAESRMVRFTFFEITEPQPGLQALRQIDQIDAVPGQPAASRALPTAMLSVANLGTSKLSAEEIEAFRRSILPETQFADTGTSPDALVKPDPTNPTTLCCVTCGSTTACGCAVSMTCGSCCDGACCGGSGGTQPSHRFSPGGL